MPNFSSVALFVQKLFRWSKFTHPNCLTYIKKPNWERVKKKATFVQSEKVEMVFTFQRNRHFRKVSVNKTFTHVQEQKQR